MHRAADDRRPNESKRPDRWRGDVRALVTACRRYPHVALVLSCRTELVGEVIGDVEEAVVVAPLGPRL